MLTGKPLGFKVIPIVPFGVSLSRYDDTASPQRGFFMSNKQTKSTYDKWIESEKRRQIRLAKEIDKQLFDDHDD